MALVLNHAVQAAIDLVVFVSKTRSARIPKDGRFREDTDQRTSNRPKAAANEHAHDFIEQSNSTQYFTISRLCTIDAALIVNIFQSQIITSLERIEQELNVIRYITTS
jgi:hypothetical protein